MSEKKQIKRIILTNTKRTGEDYLKSLEFRNNGNYDKLPNYVVMKNGDLIKTLEVGRDTNFFDEDVYNKNSIIISLENLGCQSRGEDWTGWSIGSCDPQVFPLFLMFQKLTLQQNPNLY